MTYRTDMEAAFEEWFDRHGLFPMCRADARAGWMGAVLWCRLCQREHEGACIEAREARK